MTAEAPCGSARSRRTFPQAASDYPLTDLYYCGNMRPRFGLQIALTLRPAGPAHPLFDNLELNTFSSRTLQIPYLTPFGSYPCALFRFPYTTYATRKSLFSIGCTLFAKNRGVWGIASQSGTGCSLRTTPPLRRFSGPGRPERRCVYNATKFFRSCFPASVSTDSG